MSVLEVIRPIPPKRPLPEDKWMPPAGVRIISTDDHNLEPLHLWEERLPAQWRDKAPKLYRDGDGALCFEAEGRSLLPKGVDEGVSQGMPGYWDMDAKLASMDAEGVEKSFLFHGIVQGLNGLQDKDLYWACMDVYNDWLSELTRPHADRLIGVGILPTFHRPEATADYLQKMKALGYKSIQMPAFPRGIRYNSRSMDPLWKAIEDSGFPLTFHVGAYIEFHGYGSLGANITRNLSPYRGLLGQLMFAGVFERFPQLKVVFTEGGAAWAASAISDMDYIFKAYYTELNPKLGMLPSEFWRRQCYVSFMADPVGIRLVDLIGEDNMMWGSDYPHAEGTWGFSNEVMESMWNALGPVAGEKVLGGNAIKLWNL